MAEEPKPALPWVDPDDAPELTEKWFKEAEYFVGSGYVGRVGRREEADAQELISVRLDPDIVAKLREAGPGWQSQINTLLRTALRLDKPTTKRARSA